jgi:hypothetical protein
MERFRIEPADPEVLLAFSLVQKWPARTHPEIWKRLIKAPAQFAQPR